VPASLRRTPRTRPWRNHSPSATHRDRLDLLVGRDSLDGKPGPEFFDALAVERIHFERAHAGQHLEPPSGRQMNVVNGGILNVEWLIFVLAMVETARNFLDMLIQRAAIGDVKLLETATQRE
jgi:hypothetical protein